MPVSHFFDAIVIGDGENVAPDICHIVGELKKQGASRHHILKKLSEIAGIFIPSGDTKYKIGRQIVADLDRAAFPARPVIPYESTQMRVAVEAARGCAHGCRFCQAGYVYRPVRQRSCLHAADIAAQSLKFTGHEEFSFLSLSIGDWSPLETSLLRVHELAGKMQAAVTLPSMRVESMTDGIAAAMGRARSGSFTLAPEAATWRMRRFINKGNTDENLYASVDKIFAGGWHAVKLYFMIGLPNETDEEIDGIVEMANRCLDIGKRYHKRPDVTVSTSVFIPKAHTPFQWDAQISIEEAVRIQAVLKKKLRRPGLYYRWHDARQSFLEGVFARGGDELSCVIEIAHGKGARFDGWDECFDFNLWMDAFREAGISPHEYHKKRPFDFKFPWQELEIGPSIDFLKEERRRSELLIQTPDCTGGDCQGCGLCNFVDIKNRLVVTPKINSRTDSQSAIGANTEPKLTPPSFISDDTSHVATKCQDKEHQGTMERKSTEDAQNCDAPHRYRFQYAKEGLASFLAAVETLDMLRPAFRAAGIPLRYTEGYHPRPKIASGPALGLGLESLAEFLDAEVDSKIDIQKAIDALNERLPSGIKIVGAVEISSSTPSIDDSIESSEYLADLGSARNGLGEYIKNYVSQEIVLFKRLRGKGDVTVNLKDYVANLAVVSDNVVEIRINNTKPGLKPAEIISSIFDIDEQKMRKVTLKKTKVNWKGNKTDPDSLKEFPIS